MSVIDQEEKISKLKRMDNPTSKELRDRAVEGSKDLKTQWLGFAQTLYAIWRDKLYEYWGYEKFDHYVEREAGIKKAMAVKMVKTYAFVEQNEPQLLKEDFLSEKDAMNVPEMDSINILRAARYNNVISKGDYAELRKQVFDRGCAATVVRRNLVAMMKERKKVDPEEEKERRNSAAIKRLMNSISAFKSEMNVLKLIKPVLVKQAEDLLKDLQREV